MLCGGAGGKVRLLPDEKTIISAVAPTLPRSKGHHRVWLDACKGGSAASSNFEYGARLTEIVLLGVASLRARRKLDWDPANLKATGAPEFDGIFKETYRNGWEIA